MSKSLTALIGWSGGDANLRGESMSGVINLAGPSPGSRGGNTRRMVVGGGGTCAVVLVPSAAIAVMTTQPPAVGLPGEGELAGLPAVPERAVARSRLRRRAGPRTDGHSQSTEVKRLHPTLRKTRRVELARRTLGRRPTPSRLLPDRLDVGGEHPATGFVVEAVDESSKDSARSLRSD